MAQLGFRTMDEMIGRVDRLNVRPALDHWKARGLDLSAILYEPRLPADAPRRAVDVAGSRARSRRSIDELIAACADALEARDAGLASRSRFATCNRTVGTMLGYEVTRRWGGKGLPDDTIRIEFTGSAGQSFGAFVPRGITLTLEGDANDYVGKGLSGGRLIVYPPRAATFVAGGEHHHRQRRALRRDERRGIHPRRGRRAVRGPQQRRASPSSKASATTAANT